MDPVVSKVGTEGIRKSLESAAGSSKLTPSSGGSFDKMMEMMMKNLNPGQGIKVADGSNIAVTQTAAKEHSAKAGHWMEMLKEFNSDMMKFEDLNNLISSGKNFSPQELLAVQVGVGHLSQQLEIFSKVLDNANKIFQMPNQVNFG